jgi:hypothetical protein
MEQDHAKEHYRAMEGEPLLATLLADPMVHMVMERDGVSMEGLEDLIKVTRERLSARHMPNVA